MLVIADCQHGAVGHTVTLTLTTVLIGHGQFAGARHRHQVAALVLDHFDVVQAHNALGLDADAVDGGGT